MNHRLPRITLIAAACCAFGNAGAVERATPREAYALFEQAVKYEAANGPERAFVAFNDRKGRFARKDLYVFVIDRQGTYHANGAAPEALVGMNVLETRDAAGNPIFRQMVDVVGDKLDGVLRYVWLNRATNKVEPKTTYLHRSGDYIIGVGYFAPRSKAQDARRMLDNALAYVKSWGMDKAAPEFNNRDGQFVADDLYVFAIDIKSGKYQAMGMNPALTGSDAHNLHDAAGRPLVQDMIALVNKQGAGRYDYVWRNPVTNAVEKKHAFVRREGDSLIGVGYYTE